MTQLSLNSALTLRSSITTKSMSKKKKHNNSPHPYSNVKRKKIDVLYPLHKLDRARQTTDVIRTSIDAHFASTKNKIGNRKFQVEDTSKLSTQLSGIAEKNEIDPTICVLIGEVLHNLRSSLDHIAAAGVKAGGADITRRIAFPIHGTRNRFEQSYLNQLAGAPIEFTNIISGFEPYGDSDDKRLFYLWELNNQDKHEAIIITEQVLKTQTTFSNKLMPIVGKGLGLPTQDGKKPIAEPLAQKTFLRHEVAFGENRVLAGKSIIGTLTLLNDRVAQVIKAVEQYRY